MSDHSLTVVRGDFEPASPPVYAMTAITPMAMLSQAVERGASIETLEKLMGLQERWEANQGRKAFDNAMAEAKAEIPVIFKNRVVDFTSAKGRTSYKHEDLAEIARTVNPILAKHGLSYRFRSSVDGAMVTVTCVVSHRAGYFEENTLSAAKDDSGNKNSIQAVGSSLTYLQRMTLKASLGLAASDDDDGKASSGSASALITEDQVLELRDLIMSVDGEEGFFRKIMKVEALADIYADKFDAAKALILQKAKR